MAGYDNKAYADVTGERMKPFKSDETEKKGCNISPKMGLLLGAGAVCLAVATGLIAHFATKSGAKECGCPAVPTAPPTTPTPPPVYSRLPRDLIPHHYNVMVQPNIYELPEESFTFTGSVDIFMTCKEATDKVILNVKFLEVPEDKIVLRRRNNDQIQVKGTTEDKDLQMLTINLEQTLQKNVDYTLTMEFTGPLSLDFRGIYLSHYKQDGESNKTYLVCTQFEPGDARKAFPCFDEPDFKATFNQTIRRKNPFHSRGNTKLLSSVDQEDGWVLDTFDTTPIMPSYLYSILISDFESKDATHGTVEEKIWARPNAIDQGQYASVVAGPILQWFEDYTDIPFEFSKIDHVALPHFAFGAMENWGLITYRESYLLYDEDESTTRNQNWITFVIAHELAHMWFGNLVTCAWWDDIFVNEALASFFQYRSHLEVKPHWDIEHSFLRESAFIWETDGFATSEPMYHDMAHELPTNYMGVFHRQVYYKGPLIMRMMDYVLGTELLRDGLRHYLKELRYGVATVEDLWQKITEVSTEKDPELNMTEKIDPYIKQMGYPVVKVARTAVDSPTVTLTQKHFLYNPEATKPPSPYNYAWDIPISYYHSDLPALNTEIKLWLKRGNGELSGVPTGSDSWLVLNTKRLGYYRVEYDDELRQNLIKQLERAHTVIDPINRWQFIDDLFALAKAGHIREIDALESIKYLDNEEEQLPWQAAFAGTTYIRLMFRWTPSFGYYQDYMKNRYNNIYNKVGWDKKVNETLRQNTIRLAVLSMACSSYHVDCIQTAETRFKNWMSDTNNRIRPDLRPVIYCTSIREGGPEEWDFLYEQYQTSNVASAKSVILTALACSNEYWVLRRYLTRALNKTETLHEDLAAVATALATTSVGRGIIWDHLQANWNTTLLMADAKRSTLVSVAEGFNTDLKLKQIEKLAAEKGIDEDKSTFDQAKEIVENNIKWMNDNYESVSSWLMKGA